MEPIRGVFTAFRTLSILPLPGKDAGHFASSLYSFTLVGVVLGALLCGFVMGMFQLLGNQWPELLALGVVAGGVMLTRGLHLDGLADFADGFWGAYSREKTLSIMKDTTLGAFGVIALILILLSKWIALVRLLELGGVFWIITAYTISRLAMVELIVIFPYARLEGTARPFVEDAGQRHRLVNLLTGLIVVYLMNRWAGIGALLIGLGLIRLFGFWCLKRVGGITGDLLGACSEMIETVILTGAVIYLLLITIYF